MLGTRWTWMLAVVALALPVFATGCSNSCDDADEICDRCDPDTRSSCRQQVNNCELLPDGPGFSESDCCDNVIDSYDRC